MNTKALIFLLMLSSLFGYLEWGGDKHSFLFEAECEVFRQVLNDPKHLIHPFVLLPLLGQILLLLSLLQKKPEAILIYTGMTCLALLLGFMFFIGIIGMNFKIFISTLPFTVLVVLTITHLRKQKLRNKKINT